MSFLAFDIFQLIKDGIGYAVQAGIRTIFYEICSFIYGLIINIYDVFNALCNAQLLDIEIIKDISQRVGLILGLIMFFIVSFSFIQMVLDPEKMTDKEMGATNIIKKVLIVIVMFGVSPFIFDTLQTVQENIISNNVLNRILLPNNYAVDDESFGKVIALNLFTSFYHLDEYKTEDGEESSEYNNCSLDFNYLQRSILSDGDFSSSCVTTPVNYTDNSGTTRFGFIMNFNYILSLIVGIFVCYCFIMYTISVGIRTVQLAFLQMISPMAFIAYLTPKKDNLFSKWLKMYIMTFLDVFIRIAIISLGVFLISIILDSWTDVTATGDGFGSVFWHSVAGEDGEVSGVLYIKIIMILAILSFMKKAPDLIKQLIPSSGATGALSYGLSAKDNPGFGMGKAVVGGAVGGVVAGGISALDRYKANKVLGKSKKAAVGGAIGGLASGALRGVLSGGKSGNMFKNIQTGVSEQAKSNERYADLISEGGSSFGSFLSKVQSAAGGETAGQLANRRLQNIKALSKYKKSINDAADSASFVGSFKSAAENLTQWAGETEEHFRLRKDEAENKYRGIRKAFQEAAIAGRDTITSFSYKDANGVDQTMNVNYVISSDADDNAAAFKIRTQVAQAEEFRSSHNVEYYNPTTDSFESVGPIRTRSDVSDLSALAEQTEIYITSRPDFSRNVANDRAAGVDRTKNDK